MYVTAAGLVVVTVGGSHGSVIVKTCICEALAITVPAVGVTALTITDQVPIVAVYAAVPEALQVKPLPLHATTSLTAAGTVTT